MLIQIFEGYYVNDDDIKDMLFGRFYVSWSGEGDNKVAKYIEYHEGDVLPPEVIQKMWGWLIEFKDGRQFMSEHLPKNHNFYSIETKSD